MHDRRCRWQTLSGIAICCCAFLLTALWSSRWRQGGGLQTSTAWNAVGDLASERTFGHSGASGTAAWADLQLELVCVTLTTRPWRQGRGFLLRRLSNVVQGAVE